MKPVTIYTTRTCGYCRMAKALLARKGAAFEEVDVTFDRARRAEMIGQGRRPHHACRRSGSASATSAAATTSTIWSYAGKLDALLAN